MPRTSCPPTSLVLPADHPDILGTDRYLLAPRVRDLVTIPSRRIASSTSNRTTFQKDDRRLPRGSAGRYVALLGRSTGVMRDTGDCSIPPITATPRAFR
jgi:hypothetical protein